MMTGIIARYLTMSMVGHQKRFPKPNCMALEPLTPTIMYPSHFDVTDRSVLNITHVFELVHAQKWQPFASMIHIAKSDTFIVFPRYLSCKYKATFMSFM